MYKLQNISHFFIKMHRYQLALRLYSNEIKFGPNGRTLMMQGVDILTDAVAVTMGPKGRSVILEQPFGPPKITKDGTTVAKSIELKDKFQNIGAKLTQNVATKTNDEVGDGTTTATVLARAIAKEGFESISKGANPIEIRKGIILAVNAAIGILKSMSKAVKSSQEIEHVATVSANGDKLIGKLIATAINRVGKDGIVAVREGRSLEDGLEIIDGMSFKRGFISPYFINSTKGPKVEYKDAFVLYSEKKIFWIEQIIPALEISATHKKPLLIIAEDFENEILSILVLNKIKIGLPVVAVKSPGFGEHRKNVLIDLATATGGVIFEDNTNLIRLEDCQLESLGRVEELVVSKDSTLLLRGQGDKDEIKERIEQIRIDIERTKNDFEKERLFERISALNSVVAVLVIGGSSEVEINEKKDRVNDALNATRAAIAEGIVPGGGVALLRCISGLENVQTSNQDQSIGIEIVKNALITPCWTIADNAGLDGSIIVTQTFNLYNDYGYDAMNDKYVNLIQAGIIDPTKVIRCALMNASRVASLLTTAEAVICDLPREVKKTFLGPKNKSDYSGSY